MFMFCHQVIVPLPSFEAGTRRPLTKGARAQERVRSGCVSLLHRLPQCAVLEFSACSWGFLVLLFFTSFVIPLHRVRTVFTHLVMFGKTEVPFSRPGKFGEN